MCYVFTLQLCYIDRELIFEPRHHLLLLELLEKLRTHEITISELFVLRLYTSHSRFNVTLRCHVSLDIDQLYKVHILLRFNDVGTTLLEVHCSGIVTSG